MTLTNSLCLACIAAFGLLPAACAQQPQPAGMSGMGGMSMHDMAGMDMQAMMKQCAQMRQDVVQGKQLASDMQKMTAHCDQMDRSMTMEAPAPAPAATLSR